MAAAELLLMSRLLQSPCPRGARLPSLERGVMPPRYFTLVFRRENKEHWGRLVPKVPLAPPAPKLSMDLQAPPASTEPLAQKARKEPTEVNVTRSPKVTLS